MASRGRGDRPVREPGAGADVDARAPLTQEPAAEGVADAAPRNQAPPDPQLHTWQRPTLQEHASHICMLRRGPHRRTHSSAPGSLRSAVPPGQQTPSSTEMSRSVSDSARVEIDAMCAPIGGSPALAATDTQIHRASADLRLSAAGQYDRVRASRPSDVLGAPFPLLADDFLHARRSSRRARR